MKQQILALQICDHGFMFILEFLQALGLLFLLSQVGGELWDPLLKLFLLLRLKKKKKENEWLP